MVWNLDAGWLVLSFATVGILSFIVAMALNAVMGEDGFGATGNAVVIAGGFFLAILVANGLGYVLVDLKQVLWTGFGGAFVCMFLLASAKVFLSRL